MPVVRMKQNFLILINIALAFAAPSIDQHVNSTYVYHPTIGGRIVGGDVTPISGVPWQVAVLRNNVPICGGVIIARAIVLTAAHCVAPRNTAKWSISIRSGSDYSNRDGLLVVASAIFVHPQFEDCDNCSPDYDVAVMYLNGQAVTSLFPTARIYMWDENTTFPDGTLGTVSGWGTTSEGGVESLELRSVQVPVVNEASCRDIYGSLITNRTICAGYAAGGKDACQGDSGGPFVIDNKLAGIVSFGAGCARPGFPGVYTSIPGVRDFIRRTAGV